MELMRTEPLVLHYSESTDDLALVERIASAYRKAIALEEDQGSFWSGNFSGLKGAVHASLLKDDVHEVASLLRNPAGNDLFYGFDMPCASFFGPMLSHDEEFLSQLLYDGITRLAESVGAVCCHYPEADVSKYGPPPAVEDLLAAIEGEIGIKITFPAIYEVDQGIASSRGPISYRPLQAIHQAHLLRRALGTLRYRSVVEIGAGLGRTAFYAQALGNSDYTIVDLPLTSVAQAYHLGRTLGPDRISLFGENQRGKVRIIPPAAFYNSADRFDIALNVDSLTEMSRATAASYLGNLSDRTPVMLSINHEFNQFSVRDLYKDRPEWRVDRDPYWMRHGYVIETIRFQRWS